MGFVWKCLGLLVAAAWCVGHPLEDYVKRPDNTYTYYEQNRSTNFNSTTIIINMTSQTWMDETFSSQPVWFHYVIIAIPDNIVITDQAYVFVGIGLIDDLPPDPDSDEFGIIMRNMARETGAVCAYVSNIPNQPISFPSDNVELTEDGIIARTWAMFLNQTQGQRDPDILLYFPMVKSIVRALDTITEVAALEDPSYIVDKYCIGGPSKRGWTTWLTGATDDRVVGLNPQVLSLLNMIPNLHHHYQSLGGWSWTFADYYNEGLTSMLDDPDTLELTYMQDPYESRANLTMPTYIIKAANDEFMMLDDFQFFYDDLPAVSKNVLILEDAIHIMLPHWRRLLESISSWFKNVHRGLDRVYLTADIQSGPTTANITATLLEPAINVTGWYAQTVDTQRRDYRWLILNDIGNDTVESEVRYLETPVEDLGNNQYRLSIDTPPSGWIGFFIVATFPGPDPDDTIEISTDSTIVPNSFYFPDCFGAGCKGELV